MLHMAHMTWPISYGQGRIKFTKLEYELSFMTWAIWYGPYRLDRTSLPNQMKVIDGIKSHFVPFTEDEEKKTLFINNKTITVYRSDLPNPSSCPDVSNEPISSSSLFDVNLSQGSKNRVQPRHRSLTVSGRQLGPSAVRWSRIKARKISVLSMNRQKIGRKMKFMK